MILLWCLCVCLLLAGLTCRYPLRTFLQEIWLQFFGQRVRVVRVDRTDLARRSDRSTMRSWPAFQVQTRAGPDRRA